MKFGTGTIIQWNNSIIDGVCSHTCSLAPIYEKL